ncbi:uncharacterized protein LOC142375626 [Odontesthes bonariensis]|uniref:uncharacterized protein LOC142375626 n=1 Tax=Odontesthes bonariensis TaxID=219752 RepID=UPI003F580824
MATPADDNKEYTMETRSKVSSSLHSSQVTSSSVAVARARAKAEAARVKLSFAHKEANILKKQAEQLKKKAELDADLHVLKSEKEAAAAQAEAQAWEDSAQEAGDPPQPQLVEMPQIDPAQRTQEYVQQHAELNSGLQAHHDDHPDPPSASAPQPAIDNTKATTDYKDPSGYQGSEHSKEEFKPLPFLSSDPRRKVGVSMSQHQYAVSPKREFDSRNYGPYVKKSINDSQLYHPGHNVSTPRPHNVHPTDTSDLAKYLMRREMVSSGLLKFDDQPENYWAWKTSFQSAVWDLHLLPQEELDLLAKWLGPQSAAQARRIRAAYVHNPGEGLNMVWQRLEECFGAPEIIEHALLKRVEDFPKLTNKDNQRLRDLGDLLLELQAAKQNGYLPGLSHLDTAHGVNPILSKLTYNLQEKWVTVASRYKRDHGVPYPPFTYFVSFIREEAKIRNDPSFACVTTFSLRTEKPAAPKQKCQLPISVRKTDVSSPGGASQDTPTDKSIMDPDKQCPLHCKPHPLRKCRLFRSKSLEERRSLLKDKHICFRCCSSINHMARDCNVPIKCRECESETHTTALHPEPLILKWKGSAASEDHGGEQRELAAMDVTSKCTEICGNLTGSRSCSKICLVRVYPDGQSERAVKMYAVLDEQSNRSLAKTDFFNLFSIDGHLEPYTLKTCSGVMDVTGRRANNFIIESLDGMTRLSLPTLIECDMIPDDRAEIPAPEVAVHYSHLKPVAGKIPEIDPQAEILILLGRDILSVHKVREQHNGLHNEPYAQRLDLGWVIVGEVCLGAAHKTFQTTVYKTNILHNGRASLLGPCTNTIQVKERLSCHTPSLNLQGSVSNLVRETDDLGCQVFQKTEHDDNLDLSIEDRIFLKTLDQQTYKDEANTWVAPLPFRSPRNRLPNNRPQAEKRLSSVRRNLDKKPQMKKDFISFMQKIFDANQAEPAPQLTEGQECWYLPLFGVYHPRKPEQIRVVFDSSAKHEGLSLNDVLLCGPDLNNTLLGVLIRFRKEPVAVTADVQQMFYCFTVCEEHRDFLRFLWYEDNDLQKPVKEFRMTVHVFGNSPSPAVAIYCLRRAASESTESTPEAREFVMRNFYVDDALASFPTETDAIKVLQSSQEMLAESNIRLHKIASNSSSVMQAFPTEDWAKGVKDFDFGGESPSLQRSLGLSWNLVTDSFTFCVSSEEKPLTKRGILSTVNSLFDPLGFVAPVTVGGRNIMRELSVEQYDWDAPLPTAKQEQWKLWRNSMKELEQLDIPRPYVPVSLATQTQYRELCVFSDASDIAIAAVAYLRTVSMTGECHVGFVMGKSKLTPRPAHTVPRLELCAAVLAVEMVDFIKGEMDIDIHSVKFYTDSKIVLGYINNTSRRFYVYVSNRITRIRKSSHPHQWHYINTEQNPADHGTRPLAATDLKGTNWFSGPSFLSKPQQENTALNDNFELIHPDQDQEIRPEVTAISTKVTLVPNVLGAQRFERFSSWKSLVRAISRLIKRVRSKVKVPDSDGSREEESVQATVVIIRSTQQEVFFKEIEHLIKGDPIPRQSPLVRLSPFLDQEGLLRVGGRTSSADMCFDDKHPLIIPKTHTATLLVRHYHDQVAHQGRHFTEGALRSAGLWLIGGKRLVSTVIHKCVTCKRLRGKLEEQKMSELPANRLSVSPPFTHVGVDVFGPWTVTSRRTRGGHAESKRWAVIFTCLSTRAVHIEVLENMTTASFINGLRRFTAIRGPIKTLRSDRGTNFIGACKELNLDTEDPDLKTHLHDSKCTWIFNPPHSSHMGGVWERMIGIARRILDALLLKTNTSHLTHEVLTTLMAEVTAIMNSRPLVPVSSDSEAPAVLTPSMLLTQKAETLSAPEGDFDVNDLSIKHWRKVQGLADAFWKRWRQEYLVTLQPRKKWHTDRCNLQVGDVVLLKDSQARRTEWPTGLIVKTVPSQDGRVRKVEVRVVKQGVPKVYLRPISEIILLFPKGNV